MIMGKNKEDLRDLRDIYEERIRGCGISMALDIKWKKKDPNVDSQVSI